MKSRVCIASGSRGIFGDLDDIVIVRLGPPIVSPPPLVDPLVIRDQNDGSWKGVVRAYYSNVNISCRYVVKIHLLWTVLKHRRKKEIFFPFFTICD